MQTSEIIYLLNLLKHILLLYLADGKTVDATQEMLALGACNLISSFVGSMPISGALSRGAVNNASGVKTTFGGVYTGKTSLSVAVSLTMLLDLYLCIIYVQIVVMVKIAP